MTTIAGANYTLYQGDCLAVMPALAAQSVDAIVTDPPYGLGFMGADWDHGVPGVHFWAEALRVAKPGAYLLAFGGTRTFHRLACAIEDAGWEIRDTIMWVYGSGFPKSLDASKAIDKAAGVEREVVGWRVEPDGRVMGTEPQAGGRICNPSKKEDRKFGGDNRPLAERKVITAPATPEAEQWQGWGTALKPAWEPIIVARKPLEGTVADNVLKWGTGAINVDGCRVEAEDALRTLRQPTMKEGYRYVNSDLRMKDAIPTGGNPKGRWPANVIHDGSDEVTGLFPVTTSGGANGNRQASSNRAMSGPNTARITVDGRDGDTGSAARFFYCAKASKEDRDEGLEGLEKRHVRRHSGGEYAHNSGSDNSSKNGAHSRNHHPTVKPTALMRWLCRLVTPPGGVVLDPFMGSGSTGKAALLEGFRFAGIDLDADYIQIAHRRIDAAEVVARNAAGDLTPTARERASGQLSLLDYGATVPGDTSQM